MDIGKEQIFAEARRMRIKDVKIQFVEPKRFNVVDEEGNLKYVGEIDPDDCTCMSFIQGNKDRYVATHAEAFQCKHLMKAKEMLNIEY